MERQHRRRRRPALSCIECRRRKIKCDRNEPCAHCVAARTQCAFKIYRDEPVVQPASQAGQPGQSGNVPVSALSPSVYESSPSARPREVSRDRPATESHSEPRVSGVLRAAAATPTGQNEAPGSSKGNDIPPSNPPKDTEPDLRQIFQRLQKLEASASSVPSPIHDLAETGRDILARQTGLNDSQVILNKTRMLGWSHLMGIAQEFALVYACCAEAIGSGDGTSFQGAQIRPLLTQISDHLQKCKSIARILKVGRPSRSLSAPGFDLTPPSREMADTMAALYFGSFESTHRILHIPTFWAEYQRYWSSPESATSDLRLKILLVIGIGSSLYEHGDADDAFRNTVHQWVYAAQTWLSGPVEKDRLTTAGLQIYCLTILARQVFSVGGDLVWMSMGALIHQAMQMGLHRDPKHLPSTSVLQAEIRRRLWATILEFAVQASLDSAMPTRISFDEFDTDAPSNVNDKEMDESTTTLQPHPKDTYTTTSIQLILHDSLPIRLRVLQLLNSLHSELSYLEVLGLSAEVSDACRACSIFTKKHEGSGVTPFHRNLVDYLVRRFLIPLHCPFASKGRTNPLFYYSRKVSLDVAMAIISPEPDEGFSRLIAIGGGTFREGIRYAISVVCLELLAQVEAQRLDGTLHRNSQQIGLLKQAVKDMIALSVERIRQGETNIKGPMFLSMVLAQAEAAEAGADCEFKVAQSATESLEFCLDLLRTRLGTLSLPSPSDTGLPSTSPDGEQNGDYGLDDFGLEIFLAERRLFSG